MNSTANQSLMLGKGESGDIKISLKTLQRHFGCFGSSGSGKTVMSKVLVEEFLTNTESKLIGRLENNQKLMRDNQKLMRDNQTKIITNQNEIHKQLDGICKKLNGDL